MYVWGGCHPDLLHDYDRYEGSMNRITVTLLGCRLILSCHYYLLHHTQKFMGKASDLDNKLYRFDVVSSESVLRSDDSVIHVRTIGRGVSSRPKASHL